MTDTDSRDERPLLVTSALPYANGPIHFGHVAGAYLPADIFVRYHRLAATDVLYICGTDEHGVSITVNAEKEGKPYREYVTHWYDAIVDVFERFGIDFDHFSRTSNEDPHYALSQEFFLRLLREGSIAPRSAQQHYCTTCDRFLPDRYVEGTCYLCGGAARGDECKACGSWLEAVKLIDPRCATCGATPEVRDTMQFELDLSIISDPERLAAEQPVFRNWLENNLEGRSTKASMRATVFDKLIRGEGLQARAITRDLRWGVPIPARDLDGNDIPEHAGKVLYVWFDAPIGYVSATIEWARQHAAAEDAWRRYWITAASEDYSAPDDRGRWPGPRLVHFIGKDNIPFHCIVFPAMLAWQGATRDGDDFLGPGAGERWVLPEDVPANEFYNLEGRKFSTSDNWTLDIERMFADYGVDALRWYLTVSMPETADSQFRFAGLRDHVNADLADKVGNYASRVLKFVKSRMDGKVPEPSPTHQHEVPVTNGEGEPEPRGVTTFTETGRACAAALEEIAGRIERHAFRGAAEALIDLARLGNLWFDAHAPWKSRKLEDPTDCRTALWCHVQILATLSVGMWPFVPDASDRLRAMLGLPALTGLDAPRRGQRSTLGPQDVLWRYAEVPAGHEIGEPGILFVKIDDETVAAERERLEAAKAG